MTTDNSGSTSAAQKSYIEQLIELSEKGTTSEARMKKRYLNLVENSSGSIEYKRRLIRICKVLEDWSLIKLYLLMPDKEIAYLESLNLSANKTYFVQANDSYQLDKFKCFYLLTDGTDFMAKETDLSTLVSGNLGETEELQVADIERGASNLNIIYIRKNMGLMGKGNDLYINILLNHVSFRGRHKRHTLILSEVSCRAITDSGEVTPIILSTDRLKTRSGRAQQVESLDYEPAEAKPVKETKPRSTSTQQTYRKKTTKVDEGTEQRRQRFS